MIKAKGILVSLGLSLLLALIVVACGGDLEPAGEAPETDPTQPQASPTVAVSRDEPRAPELTGITSWINSEPFTLESQRGKVVLVDFWTYTCINCIRTFPYLKEWHEKYGEQGLVIVGVHSPEFEFEKSRENVVVATIKHGLKYPVAQDNDFATWRAYKNRFWPAKYLIDKDGYIRYTHFGEGDYAETEQKIAELLTESGPLISETALSSRPEPEVDPRSLTGNPLTGVTRELYAGFERNVNALRAGLLEPSSPPYILHREFYDEPGVMREYEDPGDHENHFLYIHGAWLNGPDSLRHGVETQNYEDYLAIRFYATTVNVVMSPEGGEPYEVRVTLDGEPLKPSEAGADVRFDLEGNSHVVVDESDMYRLVSVPQFEDHELKLSSNSDDFSVFAFTFGSYRNQPES